MFLCICYNGYRWIHLAFTCSCTVIALWLYYLQLVAEFVFVSKGILKWLYLILTIYNLHIETAGLPRLDKSLSSLPKSFYWFLINVPWRPLLWVFSKLNTAGVFIRSRQDAPEALFVCLPLITCSNKRKPVHCTASRAIPLQGALGGHTLLQKSNPDIFG